MICFRISLSDEIQMCEYPLIGAFVESSYFLFTPFCHALSLPDKTFLFCLAFFLELAYNATCEHGPSVSKRSAVTRPLCNSDRLDSYKDDLDLLLLSNWSAVILRGQVRQVWVSTPVVPCEFNHVLSHCSCSCKPSLLD